MVVAKERNTDIIGLLENPCIQFGMKIAPEPLLLLSFAMTSETA